MNYIAIIPARYQSTRFPGKPLALLEGKPIIQHVYENARKVFEHCWVATDDERIAGEVTKFDGKVVMTSPNHQSGTDRCSEAAKKISGEIDFDVVVNIQGDEPFVREEQLKSLMSCFNDPETEIATLIRKVENNEVLFNYNRPKVVIDEQNNALLFSRQTIPFVRGEKPENWINVCQFYNHLGLYAYKKQVLPEITKLKPSKLELAESLEQMRWLENGYRIKTAITVFESIGIDTPEDLEMARNYILKEKNDL